MTENELGVQCPRLNVSMWQGNATWHVGYSGPYCGRQPPPAFMARGTATISYNYQPTFENYGFRVQYNIFGMFAKRLSKVGFLSRIAVMELDILAQAHMAWYGTGTHAFRHNF